MKISLHSQREYESKIQQLEQKLEKSLEKCRKYSKGNKYLRKRNKELIESRDNWKAKNVAKSGKIKGLKRKLEKREKVKRHHYGLWIIVLCIKLRVQAGCSYRGICKILVILQTSFQLDMTRLPCANTIENWVSKMGYYCIENAGQGLPGKEVCLVMDESIKQGNERILLLLITPWHKEKEEALAYKDVRVCYLGGKSSWTGEKIKEEVEKIEKEKGIEIKGILSDEDSKLLKACRLLEYPHLPDINHAVASCLRKTFDKNSAYKLLIKQITSYQYKSVNQDLSYLRPPKQRVRARFMNQKGFIEWGLTMLNKFEELSEKENTFFNRLSDHEHMLNVLHKCIETGERITNILKIKGLSSETMDEVEQIYYEGLKEVVLLAPIPFKMRRCKYAHPKKQTDGFCLIEPLSYPVYNIIPGKETKVGLFGRFLAYLKTYIDKYRAFLKTHKSTYNISSDIIESMFGKHKSISATNTLVGVSQLDLELPVHNVEQTEIPLLAKMALESTFTSDLEDWVKMHSSDNQANKRRKFFGKKN